MKVTIWHQQTQRNSFLTRFLIISFLLVLLVALALVFKRPDTTSAAMQATSCQLPSFQKVGSFAATEIDDVVAADFNHDGKQDVMVVRPSLVGQCQTFMGNGAGGFTPVAGGNGFSFLSNDEILMGEFNGDGFPDLYVRHGNFGSGGQVQVYLNDGQGRFTLGAEINARVLSFVVGDVNNDGRDDVLANTSGNYAVYLTNANRTFTRLPNDFGSGTSAVLLDVNGDGRLDFVNAPVTFGGPSPLYIWQGNGDGTFRQMDFLILPEFMTLRKVADLNRDGQPDIVADLNCNGSGSNSTKVYSLLNNGRGNFTASARDLSGRPCEVIVKGVQDFSGDGFPDIALSDGRIALNDGQGTICAVSDVCCTKYALNLPAINAVADFNGDNRADVINQDAANSLALWSSKSTTQNTPPTITPAAPLTLSQGATPTTTLATVNDLETPVANLSVTATSVPAGIALTNIANTNGTISARVAVDCFASLGQKQIELTVSDANGASAKANLVVNITPNQSPVLGTYANTTLNASTVQVVPSNAPSDDGSISSLRVTAPNYLGAITITSDGVVTIANNSVAGSYAATVTASDNCSAQNSVHFIFTIPPTPPPTGCDPPAFSLLTTLNVPAFPAVDELIPGDFNKDGFQDVIAIRKATTTDLPLSQVYFGDGKGGLVLNATLSNFDTFIQAGDLVRVGDFNGDGYLDLGILRFKALIGNRPQYASFQTLLNNKQGRFTGAGGSVFEGVFYDLEVGDLNNDGFTDALINTGYNYGVWLNNKNGTYAKLPDEFGTPPKIILADINLDGKLDVLNDSNGNLFNWLGDGTGRFRQDSFLDRGTLRLVVDVNKDGRPDIVTQASDGSLNVYQNRTAGFALTSYPEYKGEVIKSGDVNGNGAVGLFLADGRILVNDGLGRFCNYVSGFPAAAGVADFDGDGRADVLIKDATHIYLWRSERRVVGNTPPQITVGSGLQLPAGSTNYRVPLIAKISDGESSVANLNVVAIAALAGITIDSVAKDSSGNIELSFTTNFCTPPASSFTVNLEVTDEGGLTTKASVSLQLIANPAPLLGEYAQNVQAPVGQALQLNPGQRPFDNGQFSVQVIQPATGGGTAAVGGDGSLTITGTIVPGTYTVRVRVVEQQCANVTERVVTYLVTGTAPPPNSCDPLTFAAPVNIGANNNPYGLASGDFNGDGKTDLVVTNLGDDIFSNSLTVLLATSNGFVKSVPILFTGQPNYVATQDLNKDGKLDFAVVDRFFDVVHIYLGNGDGSFTEKGAYTIGNKSTGVAIGDFNRDGKLDLALPNDGLGNVAILNGNGDGSFGLPRYVFAGDSPQPGVVGDFNKDGFPDLAFPNYNSGNVVVLLGLQFGGFNGALIFNTNTGAGLEAIAIGDLDGDGNLDLALTNTTTNVVTTLRGDGRGMFTSGGGFNTFSNYPASIVVADFTGDGKADIAMGGYNDDTVRVFKGLGNGFDNNNPTIIKVGSHPLSLLTTDFNGDGKADLAVVGNGSGTVSVLLNGCGK